MGNSVSREDPPVHHNDKNDVHCALCTLYRRIPSNRRRGEKLSWWWWREEPFQIMLAGSILGWIVYTSFKSGLIIANLFPVVSTTWVLLQYCLILHAKVMRDELTLVSGSSKLIELIKCGHVFHEACLQGHLMDERSFCIICAAPIGGPESWRPVTQDDLLELDRNN